MEEGFWAPKRQKQVLHGLGLAYLDGLQLGHPFRLRRYGCWDLLDPLRIRTVDPIQGSAIYS